MTDAVQDLVFDALRKGRFMRDAQRAYFTLRTQEKLDAAKRAERDFDHTLDEAAYAVKHGAPRPTQGEFGF